ncbi:MAG TPA: hypothetical protein PKX03_02310, partial [Candidatus Paceibacterota bacterium]|nr:hypothetical protein [Candidatus Paceibacterota bacterium]
KNQSGIESLQTQKAKLKLKIGKKRTAENFKKIFRRPFYCLSSFMHFAFCLPAHQQTSTE